MKKREIKNPAGKPSISRRKAREVVRKVKRAREAKEKALEIEEEEK